MGPAPSPVQKATPAPGIRPRRSKGSWREGRASLLDVSLYPRNDSPQPTTPPVSLGRSYPDPLSPPSPESRVGPPCRLVPVCGTRLHSPRECTHSLNRTGVLRPEGGRGEWRSRSDVGRTSDLSGPPAVVKSRDGCMRGVKQEVVSSEGCDSQSSAPAPRGPAGPGRDPSPLAASRALKEGPAHHSKSPLCRQPRQTPGSPSLPSPEDLSLLSSANCPSRVPATASPLGAPHPPAPAPMHPPCPLSTALGDSRSPLCPLSHV